MENVMQNVNYLTLIIAFEYTNAEWKLESKSQKPGSRTEKN